MVSSMVAPVFVPVEVTSKTKSSVDASEVEIAGRLTTLTLCLPSTFTVMVPYPGKVKLVSPPAEPPVLFEVMVPSVVTNASMLDPADSPRV